MPKILHIERLVVAPSLVIPSTLTPAFSSNNTDFTIIFVKSIPMKKKIYCKYYIIKNLYL